MDKLEQIPCNLCGANESEGLYRKGGLDIARCRQCGLVYANPRLTQSEIWKRYSPTYFWNEYMPAHNAPNGEFAAEWHRQRARPILDYLKPYQKSGSLLEVGCAAGFFLKIAEEDGWQTRGVEIMAPAVEYARTRLNLDVLQGTLDSASFADASFDVVVMIETIEHLLDPASELREAYRILRPDGAIWVATPNLNSVMLRVFGTDWSVLSPSEHLFYFTEKTLAQMLKQVGFRTVQFIWHFEGQPLLEIMNPYNTNHPRSWRSRVIKWSILTSGQWIAPLVVMGKRTDRLTALTVK